MQVRRLFSILITVPIAIVSAVSVGRLLQRRRATRHRNELRRLATTDRSRTVTTDDFEDLPNPVRDYFANVLDEGQQYVETVTLKQTGELRPGDSESAWKPFTATQYITTDPPGFFWDATVRFWPLVDIHIGDRYCDGDGHARVSALGLVPLGGDDTNPELNRGELLRYLAEAVWYPTALLPSHGVEWDPVDERTATATLESGDTSATLTFHFTDDDEVSKVHAEQRPRRVDDRYEPTPWTGRWHDYQIRNGMRVPTAGEVIWQLPDGEMEAWRGRLTEISYDH